MHLFVLYYMSIVNSLVMPIFAWKYSQLHGTEPPRRR